LFDDNFTINLFCPISFYLPGKQCIFQPLYPIRWEISRAAPITADLYMSSSGGFAFISAKDTDSAAIIFPALSFIGPEIQALPE